MWEDCGRAGVYVKKVALVPALSLSILRFINYIDNYIHSQQLRSVSNTEVRDIKICALAISVAAELNLYLLLG